MPEFVVYSSEKFDIIQESAYHNEIYKDVGVRLDANLFAINGPFMMDSQFDAMQREGRRIRKRKKNSYVAEVQCNVIAAIETISKDVREAGLRMGFFSAQASKDNNRVAREKARAVFERGVSMYRPEAICSTEIVGLTDDSEFIVDNEFCQLNCWYRNDSDHCIRLNVAEGKNTDRTTHYIPHGATFHIGSVSDVRNFAAINGEVYDLIIMDPPWENLAVKRQRSYVTSASPLSSVTVESLSRDGLIAVWITNRSGIERELESCFRRWNVKRLAAFYWLKVTLEGDPVCSFNGAHKLPYEKLVFASREEYAERYSAICSADGKVFASVPMALPSRKPPVLPLLKHFGIAPGRSLELFARCLLPHTVSVGFETLLLQSSICLIPDVDDSSKPEKE